MNKAELVAGMVEKTKENGKEGTKKEAEMYLNAFLDTVKDELIKKEKVQLIGFGTFETRERSARTGRNPRNPEETIQIPAATAPAFKAGKALKEAVNGK